MLSHHKYIKTGKCIWCGRTEADGATFNDKPHIVPHGLGGQEIGVDVCDECNHYFGTAPRAGMPPIDLAFKEIFNAFMTFGHNLNENTYKHFKSVFFEYRHSKHTIRIKSNFNSHNITIQFKRGLYEVFLQQYHAVTGKGNNRMFDAVRKYARYGRGHLHVFYTYNHIIFEPGENEMLKIPMKDKVLDQMIQTGVYPFWMGGHWFYLEVFPVAFCVNGEAFLKKEAEHILIPIYGDERIFEFNDVMQIDFLMQRFNNEK